MTAVQLAFPMVALIALSALCQAALPEDLPSGERAISGQLDPWGLPFSDALRRFQARFEGSESSGFALGVTHDLVKVWPNKYWFRGDSIAAGAVEPLHTATLWAAAGETQSLQLAVLPRLGAAEATYKLTCEVTGPPGVTLKTYREAFVTTAQPSYPRYGSERWPDPLAPADRVTVSGLDCGVFWMDVHLPADLPAGELSLRAVVSDGRQSASTITTIKVVPGLDLQPKAFPLVAWFKDSYGSRKLSGQQMRDLGAMVLEHHMQAMDLLQGHFRPGDTAAFDELHDYLAARGQNVFQLDSPSDAYDFRLLYDHVKRAGWLDQALIYSNLDEPLAEDFQATNVPYMTRIRHDYPGLRVFLASQHHPDMAAGCDIWMTDLSTVDYDPEGMRSLAAPTLWHYYCHLPIHVQFRAPLTMAPNMEVDCEALQHRLALWMSQYYGARGVFIWAGFYGSGLGDDFWQTLQLESTPGAYPYGGIHNGNNFLVYPPQTPDGPVLPSVRLKVLRDGMEDLALLRSAAAMLDDGRVRGARAERLRELLSPVPGVFVHPHYWDRLPETLLARRREILRLLAGVV